jgi:hypothetical protein
VQQQHASSALGHQPVTVAAACRSIAVRFSCCLVELAVLVCTRSLPYCAFLGSASLLSTLQSLCLPLLIISSSWRRSSRRATDRMQASSAATTTTAATKTTTTTTTQVPTTFADALFTTSEEDQRNVAAIKQKEAEAEKEDEEREEANAAPAAIADGADTAAAPASALPPAETLVPLCGISEGLFKYVLIRATDPTTGKVTLHMRSGPGHFHADVAGASGLHVSSCATSAVGGSDADASAECGTGALLCSRKSNN